jgi:2-oxoglutarate dehydrogenase E2 component (dihydrolipoamide succinyltransferase)
MSIELKVPEVGESITEVQIIDWLKSPGEAVHQDEPIVSIETEKVQLNLPAPGSGVLVKILKKKGETAMIGEVIAHLEEATTPTESHALASPGTIQASKPTPIPPSDPMPDTMQVMPTGPEPVHKIERRPEVETAPSRPLPHVATGKREEEAVPMSLLRRRVAERLVQAQQTAALLTTFNEIDMTAVMALRQRHQEAFQQRHGVKLGLMSFFVKASIDALKLIPELNAEIRGTDMVYRRYHDIGIAIGSGRGLVVPVLRDADRLNFAEIETAIDDFARRAQDNQLTLEELQGGTFTISNGGVYGSLLSTPIVNPPQSGILGLHAIQDRPVAHDGRVVIRPMMYVALTYDHRIVDGREAVRFLKRITACVEDPARIFLEI